MKHLKRPFLVAITGGIASGKSIVSKWFEGQNFSVFYADKIGHELLNEQYFVNEIKGIVGKEITFNNLIDRKKLGEIIFNSEDKRKQLNKLLHPEIRKRMQQIIDTSSQETLIFEIPLLFENGLQKAFDLTINISARNEIKIKRIMKRDGIKKDIAQKKINSQMPELDKQKLTDVNIENSTSLKSLEVKLNNVQLIINKRKFKKVVNLLEC